MTIEELLLEEEQYINSLLEASKGIDELTEINKGILMYYKRIRERLKDYET